VLRIFLKKIDRFSWLLVLISLLVSVSMTMSHTEGQSIFPRLIELTRHYWFHYVVLLIYIRCADDPRVPVILRNNKDRNWYERARVQSLVFAAWLGLIFLYVYTLSVPSLSPDFNPQSLPLVVSSTEALWMYAGMILRVFHQSLFVEHLKDQRKD
jgi:hypothetical protein